MSNVSLPRELLNQALEALKNNAGEMRVEGALNILERALAQQDEPVKPVAWMFESERNFNLVGYGGWEKRITEYRPNSPEGSVRNVTPLYTAPPQRKPLTEDEIYHTTGHCGVSRYTAINIARAVERAHNIVE